MADFEPAIAKTLALEGGATLVDDPMDKGGLTRFGISQRSYPKLDIRTLSEASAKELYRKDYWDKISGDRIENQTVAETIFDTAVNMGARTSARLVQMALNMGQVDGLIGNQTLSALERADTDLLLARFALIKIARYVHICKRNGSQRRFLLGWINRTLGGIT